MTVYFGIHKANNLFDQCFLYTNDIINNTYHAIGGKCIIFKFKYQQLMWIQLCKRWRSRAAVFIYFIFIHNIGILQHNIIVPIFVQTETKLRLLLLLLFRVIQISSSEISVYCTYTYTYTYAYVHTYIYIFIYWI